jgi:hypothetical protein
MSKAKAWRSAGQIVYWKAGDAMLRVVGYTCEHDGTERPLVREYPERPGGSIFSVNLAEIAAENEKAKTVSKAAQRIADLINSKAKSPTVAEIDAVLAQTARSENHCPICVVANPVAINDHGPTCIMRHEKRAWDAVYGSRSK